MIRLGLAAIPFAVAGLGALRGRQDPRMDLGRIGERPPSPCEEGAPFLRVATQNLAHGRRVDGHQARLSRERLASNLRLAGDFLAGLAPDVVALQEADGPSVWSGHFDHVHALADYADFPGRYRGTHSRLGPPLPMDYGTALLGRLALTSPRSVAFEDSWRDIKGFVTATVTPPGMGVAIDVVSVHLDFVRDGVRFRQVETLIAELRGRPNPLIVLGDLNCDRGSPPFERLVSALELCSAPNDLLGPTFPSSGPKTRIDWVLVSEPLEIRRHEVAGDVVSDHLGIVADIALRT